MSLEEPDTAPMTDLSVDPLIVEGLTRIRAYGLSPHIHIEDGVKIDNKEMKMRNKKALVKACRKLDFDALTITITRCIGINTAPNFLVTNVTWMIGVKSTP